MTDKEWNEYLKYLKECELKVSKEEVIAHEKSILEYLGYYPSMKKGYPKDSSDID